MTPEENKETIAPDYVAQAEAFLFIEGGTLSKRKLATLLQIDAQLLPDILNKLSAALAQKTVRLVETENEVTLATAPEVSSAIKAAYEDDSTKEIGDAGLEVISILLYNGASTRSTIDYIRGVNTSSTVRTLLSRGLIERTNNPHDSREYLYRPTTELLAYLGVQRVEQLPEYAKISSELRAFEETQKESQGPFQTNHDNQSPAGNESL